MQSGEGENRHPRKSLKILVIMLYWYPYLGPLMPIYGSLVEELMARGHRITMITSFPHYRLGRPELWSEFRGKLFEVTSWHGMRLIRSYVFAPVFRNKKISLFCRALNFISFNISSFFSAVFACNRPDVILAPSSPPLTNGLVAWAIGLIKGCPAVYNVQDLYPDMAKQAGILKNPIVFGSIKIVERAVYRLCNKLVVLSDIMRERVSRTNVGNNKIEVIPNFLDSTKIKPGPKKNPFAQTYALHEKFVVMYAGNVGIPHGVEHVLETADLLRRREDILFCIVGRGEYKDRIVALSREKELHNVVFPPPQSEDVVPDIWASADISLVTYRKGMADFSVPSKLLATMASGRPAIVSADFNSEAAALVKRAECGLVVPPENPRALVEAIKYLLDRPEVRREMGQQGRKWVTSHHSKEFVVTRYEKLFLSVTS